MNLFYPNKAFLGQISSQRSYPPIGNRKDPRGASKGDPSIKSEYLNETEVPMSEMVNTTIDKSVSTTLSGTKYTPMANVLNNLFISLMAKLLGHGLLKIMIYKKERKETFPSPLKK